ncbi:MAG TPA: tetraprenyl-beta-curcumene synthase family protein [Thermaerobacter sp.]
MTVGLKTLRQWTLPRQLCLLADYMGRVLPRVNRTLDGWRERACTIPDPELRRQALASIRTKRFHCEGGSVFAVAAPDTGTRQGLIRLIVALQTISDYLDNLCDRSLSRDPRDYRCLHQAMLDAVAPAPDSRPLEDRPRQCHPRADEPTRALPLEAPAHGATAPPGARPVAGRPAATAYYRLHPHNDDGGYLAALVAECRAQVAALPGYGRVAGRVTELVSLYNDLQVYKHGPRETRLPRLEQWFVRRGGRFHGELYWWEFAAACGSTLGVFALFLEAAWQPRPAAADLNALLDAYFPWVCGLHILLDYFIDQAEDRAGGDLNLVSYYPSRDLLRDRLALFVREARRRVQALPRRSLHELVVAGLLGLYLSDPKIAAQGLQPVARQLLAEGGPAALACYAASRARRRWQGRHR